MSRKGEAEVRRLKSTEKKDFVKITFQPDLKRFKMRSLDDDIVGLLSKRAVS